MYEARFTKRTASEPGLILVEQSQFVMSRTSRSNKYIQNGPRSEIVSRIYIQNNYYF